MARVLRREPLPEEHVAEVSAAVGALDLDALAVRVGQTLDGADHLVSKAGQPQWASNLWSER